MALRRDLGWLTARPIAHRGYHDRAAGRVENTASAFAAAIDHDFAIECDLRLTSDEEVIVLHDETLDRLTDGGGQPERLPLSTIRALNLNGTTDRIPTLHELLDQVAGRVPLVIELKSLWTGDRRLEREVADVLTDYAGPVAVMSFDPASMRAMRDYLPHLPRGMIADRFDEASGWERIPPHYRFALRHLLLAPSVAPQFIAYDVKALPANAPLFIRHAFALPLLTWTVRSAEDRAVAARWADQMIFEGFDPDG
jgi:glycerophosphoryl diester phosphodiesterase